MIKKFILLSSLIVCSSVRAQKAEDYYKITPIPGPEGAVLEVGGIEEMPGGKLALGTRRGEIYVVENAESEDVTKIKFTKYASGMHEILGLAFKDGWLYACQRPEITRLKDNDGDGKADVYATYFDGWGQSGDYHEYNFMSKFDAKGNLWTTLCLTGSFSSSCEWRGWCLRIAPGGKMIPTCSGIRSPGGMGFDSKGECFYSDNQGPWNGSSSIKHLKIGSFQGHPGGNDWYKLATQEMGPRPKDPATNSRMIVERGKIPELVPPAVILPHGRVGQSTSAIVEDISGGKFGPFAGQLLVADQGFSNLCRCPLEVVNGVYQGACIVLTEGFSSGIIGAYMTKDGKFYCGGGDRGWGSRGGKPWHFSRLEWTGKVPFEIYDMKVRKDGFVLNFTEPVDTSSADAVASYQCEAWTYIYRGDYGSPEVDPVKPTIESTLVSPDGKSVFLKMQLTKGHVHMITAGGVKSKSGGPLIHKTAYYTLNEIPK